MFWVWGQPSLETSETEVLGLVLPFKDLNSYFCREKKYFIVFLFSRNCRLPASIYKSILVWIGSSLHRLIFLMLWALGAKPVFLPKRAKLKDVFQDHM